MSYSFDMGFINIKKNDVFDFCYNIANKCSEKENSIQMIEECKYYIPSHRLFGIPSNKSDKRIKEKLDQMWLYRMFNLHFIYWEDKEILAISGNNYPKFILNMFKLWHDFQSSCDQDYEYDTWNGIKYFENIVNDVKNITAIELLSKMTTLNLLRDKNITIDEISTDLEYHKKFFIYDLIYKELDMDNWLYGNDGNFKRFCMNGVNSQEKHFELSQALVVIKRDLDR